MYSILKNKNKIKGIQNQTITTTTTTATTIIIIIIKIMNDTNCIP